MKKSDFTLHKFNYDMKRALEKQKIGFGAMLNSSYGTSFSVTANFKPPKGEKRYVTLNKELNIIDVSDQNAGYYGVSPEFDDDMIKDAISCLKLCTLSGLDSFISEHCSLFMIHADRSEYLLDLARYIVVSVSSNFGIRLKVPKKEYSKIIEAADKHGIIAKWDTEKTQEEILLIKGCPSYSVLKAFEGCRFTFCERGYWEVGTEGLQIKDIYSDRNNITLLQGEVFYSGVFLKPVQIEKLVNRHENKDVDSIIIYFERSTYATVFAFDNNFTKHPLLSDNNKKIVEMLRYDDSVKGTLIKKIERSCDSKHVIKEINEYLDCCFNVNQIGVSANIITGEGILVMGCRSNKSIDNGFVYPGVNGNSELADKNVSFYSFSVYEDYPTIAPGQDRMDFLGEISREAYAELKIDLPKLEWHCYGIMISGNRTQENRSGSEYDAPSRRLHFNIIFEQHIEKDFESIVNGSKYAAEKFENKDFFGFKIMCYENRFQMILGKILSCFETITNQKDVVESILILILFLSSLFRNDSVQWSDYILMVLSAIIVLSTIRHLWMIFIRSNFVRKRVRHVTLYTNMSSEKKDELLSSLFKGYSFHPAAYAAMKCYSENLLFRKLDSPKKNEITKVRKKQ